MRAQQFLKSGTPPIEALGDLSELDQGPGLQDEFVTGSG
jgi:hypothetical protein